MVTIHKALLDYWEKAAEENHNNVWVQRAYRDIRLVVGLLDAQQTFTISLIEVLKEQREAQ